MSSYVLSCCSTADLSAEHLQKRDIHYICFHFFLNGKEYPDDLGKSIPFEDFYKAMADGAETKTSQINVEEYIAYFEPFLKQGKDILHISLSSGISGSCNSAKIAKETLEEKYPERKIRVVDSLGASSGYGLLMNKLADLRDQGMDIDELTDWANQHKLELHHWFF
ncbi:MAG: DegV family protein, partial [Clostridiales bacterium]|nr:DegV family protein [Clostridiales bacterium]